MQPPCQADTPWRKVAAKLEGEPAYEELDKVDRVEVYAEYIRCNSSQAEGSRLAIKLGS